MANKSAVYALSLIHICGDHGVRVAAACPGGGAFGDFPGVGRGI